MDKNMMELLPKPKKIAFTKNRPFIVRGRLSCSIPKSENLSALFMENKSIFREIANPAQADVVAKIDRNALSGYSLDTALLDEGYILEITGGAVKISARTGHGLFYGFQTLRQLVSSQKHIPAMRIEDWPDMRYRGLHLMLGALMPNFERMKRIVEILAKHKFNSFVIEYDNCFKWEKYPFISPPYAYTAEQTGELEEFAADRFIEIIPCLDSLGHAQPYLHHKRLAHLRENPDNPDSLCPSNPDAMNFMKDLWREVLAAHPRARQAHVTGDEAFQGNVFCRKCKARIRKEGVGGLVVKYYTELTRWIKAQGREPVMWNDMLVKFADNTEAVPNDIVMCDWMYENFNVAKWSGEDIYWNNMRGSTPGAWKKQFASYWEPDKNGLIHPFPYLRYFHEKGHRTIGCTASSGGPNVPYPSLARKQANIMRFAQTIKETGAHGILNTFWPMPTPLDSSWHAVLMSAEYGWHSRIETPGAFGQRFAKAFLGLEPNAGKIFSHLDDSLHRCAPGETVMRKTAWPGKSPAGLAKASSSISVRTRDKDIVPYKKILAWCAKYSELSAEIGSVFNIIDAARLGRGKDTPVDISRHATNNFDNATHPGTFAVPFKPGTYSLNGVKFNILDPERNKDKSVILLQGSRMPEAPRQVENIKVGKKADRIFVLCSGFDTYDNIPIAKMTCRMEDGKKHEFGIIGGKNILDWSDKGNKAMSDGLLVTRRRNRNGCLCWFDNPEPHKKISSLDFSSTGKHGSLTIAALTTRTFSGTQPSFDKNRVLKQLDAGTAKLRKMVEELSSEIYPEIMPVSNARSAPAVAPGTFLPKWIEIYRKIAESSP